MNCVRFLVRQWTLPSSALKKHEIDLTRIKYEILSKTVTSGKSRTARGGLGFLLGMCNGAVVLKLRSSIVHFQLAEVEAPADAAPAGEEEAMVIEDELMLVVKSEDGGGKDGDDNDVTDTTKGPVVLGVVDFFLLLLLLLAWRRRRR